LPGESKYITAAYSFFFNQSEESMKKLYRKLDDKMIAGICAGAAEILNLDVTLVRLALVFLCVITGFAPLIVTYLVGWFIIPLKSQQENVRPKSDTVT
jgi:phage shock protein C